MMVRPQLEHLRRNWMTPCGWIVPFHGCCHYNYSNNEDDRDDGNALVVVTWHPTIPTFGVVFLTWPTAVRRSTLVAAVEPWLW
jgi:hypothetical protein